MSIVKTFCSPICQITTQKQNLPHVHRCSRRRDWSNLPSCTRECPITSLPAGKNDHQIPDNEWFRIVYSAVCTCSAHSPDLPFQQNWMFKWLNKLFNQWLTLVFHVRTSHSNGCSEKKIPYIDLSKQPKWSKLELKNKLALKFVRFGIANDHRNDPDLPPIFDYRFHESAFLEWTF